MKKWILFSLMMIFSYVDVSSLASQNTDGPQIMVYDRNGREETALTDGDEIFLGVKFKSEVSAPTEMAFYLDDIPEPIASCRLVIGRDGCKSDSVSTLGWFWDANGQQPAIRRIRVTTDGKENPGGATISINPRPVVMVHGFISNWETWKPYLGPGGYLDRIGLTGFAVGDGQVPGTLNTGNPLNPSGRTNSIAQNADILGEYIEAVQQKTGAEKVDLLVHSMGGLISRYYIDRVMKNDNIAQVIFLGTPNSGSACVYPVASLGFLMPASVEIMPDYLTNIFNTQIKNRQGIPFHMIAGTRLSNPLSSPCTPAPSDTVVSLDSAKSIPLADLKEVQLIHSDLTMDENVFETVVRPLLQSPPGSFVMLPDTTTTSVEPTKDQFTQTYTGHLDPGDREEITINIDPDIALANFSLYDSSRSLAVEVRGASGKVIQLDAETNGLIVVDDPQAMIYLGYGFTQPKPGKWIVTLMTGEKTTAEGADYAINARFTGGAVLEAKTSATILTIGQPVTIEAKMTKEGKPISIESAEALVRMPDGSSETLQLNITGDKAEASFSPDYSGLHSLEVILTGKIDDDLRVDRAAYLVFEVQPGKQEILNNRIFIISSIVVILMTLAGLIYTLRKRGAKNKEIA